MKVTAELMGALVPFLKSSASLDEVRRRLEQVEEVGVSAKTSYAEQHLQALIDWSDFALRHPSQFNSHGVKNLEGPVFDEARAFLAEARSQQGDERE